MGRKKKQLGETRIERKKESERSKHGCLSGGVGMGQLKISFSRFELFLTIGSLPD